MSRFSALVTLGLLVTQSAGASVHRRWDSAEPLFKTDPGAPSDCSLWWNTDDGMPCDVALAIAGATEADLMRLPEPVPSPTRPSTPTATPTKPSNGIETPKPIQLGMVDNCNKFHLVKRGQNCNEIARQTGITLVQFIRWNPDVSGTACSGLWADVNMCVGVVGTTLTTPAGPANGIETPQPVQDGIVDNCNRFHLAVDGDNCWSVANKYGLGEAQLHQWNKGIGGAACTNIWTGYNLCIGVSGSPTAGPAVNPTPEPVQDGMVGNCNKFHLVASGDNCWNVASKYGLTESQLQQWNAGIGGSACNNM
nr:secretory protein [Falciphora oryzae]